METKDGMIMINGRPAMFDGKPITEEELKFVNRKAKAFGITTEEMLLICNNIIGIGDSLNEVTK